MSKDKTSFEKFMKSLEKLSDDIVYAFYQEDAVKTIESVSFMKKLVKSSFVKSLYDFGEGWFKQVFVVLGYLTIFGGLISLLSDVFRIFSFRGVVYTIFGLIFSSLSIISGIGMIKFKKWYPFVVLVGFLFQLLMCIFWVTRWDFYYIGYSPLSLIFTILIFVLVFALVLKNKDKFEN
ncbi:MAG: hypothetical protein PHN31_05805 [Candidatus Gracilibacteria bacterium]|nr:hypothetical protein [Candidatus Gracilibacteria bacterium]